MQMQFINNHRPQEHIVVCLHPNALIEEQGHKQAKKAVLSIKLIAA